MRCAWQVTGGWTVAVSTPRNAKCIIYPRDPSWLFLFLWGPSESFVCSRHERRLCCFLIRGGAQWEFKVTSADLSSHNTYRRCWWWWSRFSSPCWIPSSEQAERALTHREEIIISPSLLIIALFVLFGGGWHLDGWSTRALFFRLFSW